MSMKLNRNERKLLLAGLNKLDESLWNLSQYAPGR